MSTGQTNVLMNWRNYSIDKALVDPKSVFGSPDNVVSDPRLDRRAKLEILQRWRQEAYALSIAEYEGMEGEEPSMLSRVQRAIDRIVRTDNI